VEPGKHVYAYFRTLQPLRFWENHPFSVLSTPLLESTHPRRKGLSQSSSDRAHEHVDVEKDNCVKAHAVQHHTSAGLSLYAKRVAGMTKYLRANDSLLTFLEGPYPKNSVKEILYCDRVLLISGGIGITALIPFANNHWNIKLAWRIKKSARCLVDDLEGALSGIADKDVRIGSRLNIEQLLNEEIEAGWERVGVVVSGPAGLCDDARAAVAMAARRGKTEFELAVEAYS
jgi:hypothetical protein